jgi:hypothetical protein
MSKQLIFVSGSPFSGRTTWLNKNILAEDNLAVCIDANNFNSLYTNSKISEKSIELSRQWCLEEVRKLMEGDSPTLKIVLCLIACRADRWREFIQLAIEYEYEIQFKFPSNKLLFYVSKHNSLFEQYKFIESKIINKYPRDKKEVKKKDSKNSDEVAYKETNESILLKNIVTEFESGYAFYLGEKTKLGLDKEAWLKRINEHYKATIANEIKRAQKKAEKEALELQKQAERELRKLEREAKKLEKENKDKDNDEDNDEDNNEDNDEYNNEDYNENNH